MSARVAFAFVFGIASVTGCNEGSRSLAEPEGPNPEVFATLSFGDPPVTGELVLRPSPTTRGWLYSIDLDEDGVADHAGTLREELRFPFDFAEPGVHTLVVDLVGPEGERTERVPVVVNDPVSAFEVVGVVQLPTEFGYEGITIDNAGERVYVGAFGGVAIFSVRASDLSDIREPLMLQGSGLEGLAVAPGDSLLYAIHKSKPFSVIAIPSLELRVIHPSVGGYYVRALTDVRALTSGLATLEVVNVVTGEVAASAGTGLAHHFAISPDGSYIALLHGPEVLLLNLPSLTPRLVIDLTTLIDANEVAFDPAGDRIYVIGKDAGFDVRFVLLDAATGFYLDDISLGPGGCQGLCVANPVATSASGRWVAFEQGNSLLIVDTELDLPRFRFGEEMPGFATSGASVAADPNEDIFYVLSNSGLLQKVVIIE